MNRNKGSIVDIRSKGYSLVIKEINSETHSWTHSLASFAILAFSGRDFFIMRATLQKVDVMDTAWQCQRVKLLTLQLASSDLALWDQVHLRRLTDLLNLTWFTVGRRPVVLLSRSSATLYCRFRKLYLRTPTKIASMATLQSRQPHYFSPPFFLFIKSTYKHNGLGICIVWVPPSL